MNKLRPAERCPECRYLWRGLPTRGRCPECGFHYDGEMTVWHVPRWPSLASAICMGGQAIWLGLECYYALFPARALPAGVTITGLGGVPAVNWFWVYLCGIVALLSAGYAVWLLYELRQSRYMAFDSRGIHLAESRRRRFVTWAQIRLFETHQIILHNGRRVTWNQP